MSIFSCVNVTASCENESSVAGFQVVNVDVRDRADFNYNFNARNRVVTFHSNTGGNAAVVPAQPHALCGAALHGARGTGGTNPGENEVKLHVLQVYCF